MKKRPVNLGFLLSNWSGRSNCQEIMDSGEIDPVMLTRTFDHLKTINLYLSGIRKLILKTILRDVSVRKLKSITVMELGCGGGEIARWLSGVCTKRNIECFITCIDNNEIAVRYARRECIDCGNIKVKHIDAFEALKCHRADYIYVNHFLHHLQDETIAPLLQLMAESAGYGFLINDLYRSPLSLLAFSLAAPFFKGSYAVADGKISIRKGFTVSEMKNLGEFIKRKGISIVKRGSPGHLSLWFRHSDR
ncbi:MAG: methyltransferase domain-containing protein [Fibrobacter sp.]|nr:methyltransferase domain-containing protein [Fibrobacter sp.]